MNITLENLSIRAIASCVPSECVEVDSFAADFGTNEVEKIKKSTGISKLRIADTKTTTSDLCERSARHLIEKGILEPDKVDGIVFVSQTPDYILPTTSLSLQHRLGIPKSIVAFDISYGCSAYIYGIFQASILINSGCCDNVLVFVGDKISPFINSKDRSLKLLFGDAGSATIIEKGQNSFSFNFFSDGTGGSKLIIPAGGGRLPRSEETGVCTLRENENWRSDEDLFMDGAEIMNFALTEVPKSVKSVINKAGWEIDEVDTFGFHQANAFMLRYIAKILRIPIEKVPISMGNFGNTGPASIPLMLTEEFKKLEKENRLNKVILSGFGVGLSCASVALNLSDANILATLEY